MSKRAAEKKAMHFAMLTARTKLHGVTLGLLLTLLFWGSLLLRRGDVEQNPGPGPKSDGMRQTRLGSSGRRASTDRTTTSDSSGQTTPSQQPTLADVMDQLQSLNRFGGISPGTGLQNCQRPYSPC
ncbi:uncharacterized protein LOC143284194 [Babylonia areolata]|uniref:uncharacterized protein LOC143284194 n=1 Tax=Babylonia areolata TaxID=304850 RepID=UPI003FD14E52